MNSTRCGFGSNGLPYRSRHVVTLGLRMLRTLFFCPKFVVPQRSESFGG